MRRCRTLIGRPPGRLENRIAPAVFIVTTLGDAGTGAGNSGDLRYCLDLANVNGTADTITFGPLFSSPQTIVLAKDLVIAESVAIDAPTGGTTIDANGVGRVFDIINFGPVIDVSLSGLNLTGGQATDVLNQARGGAIRASSVRLSLDNCTIINCAADGGGGAIGVVGNSSTVSIVDSVLEGNVAGVGVPTPDGWGGAIDLIPASKLVIWRSTLSGNTASTRGGAISAYGDADIELIDSTLSGNRSLGSGGAVSLDSYYGTSTLAVRNSTVSGNSAGSNGGAISLLAGASNFSAENSTIVNNSAGQNGGAIARAGNAAVSVSSTIVAANVAGLAGPDIQSTSPLTVTAQRSLIGVADSPNLSVAGAGNESGTTASPLDPQLDSLKNNGGPTLSHLPLPGSPVIDAGGNDAGLANDQRGLHFPRTRGPAPDIGATEAASQSPNGAAATADVSTAGGTAYQFQVSYVDTDAIDVSSLGDGDVVVNGPGGFTGAAKFLGVDFLNNGSPRTATYEISPPGGVWDYSDNGTYMITQAANQVFDGDVPANAAPPVVLGQFVASMPATFIVDNAADEVDGNYAPGDLSLREAVLLAGQNGTTNDVITFTPGVTSISLTLGEIIVAESLTIAGPGVAGLTISGNGTARLFYLSAPALTISGVTLAGGSTQNGGGILLGNNQTLSLTDVRVLGSQATTGGGIFLGGNSTLSLTRSSVTGNSAAGLGGGIYFQNGGGLTVEASTISGNIAGFGGGLYFYGATALPVVVRNSTVASNTAMTGNGGGLALFMTGGSVVIENSTIAGNSANGEGGGIYFGGINGPRLSSTILAANQAAVGPDLAVGLATTVTGDNNLIGVADSGGFSLSGVGNKSGSAASPLDPLLGPLQNNGGPTQTLQPLAGSPALDAGNNAAALTTDQRGVGFSRLSGSQTDIGAVELQLSEPPTASVTIDDGNGQRSMVQSITVTFSEPIVFVNSAASAISLHRLATSAMPNPAGPVTLAVNPAAGPASSFTITFDDPINAPQVGAAKSLIDGKYSLTLLSAEIKSAVTGLTLDGDGNGVGGDNQVASFTRLFGDLNGDAFTDNVDYLAFRLAIGSTGFSGSYAAAFDIDGDGNIDLVDFVAFRLRLGVMP